MWLHAGDEDALLLHGHFEKSKFQLNKIHTGNIYNPRVNGESTFLTAVVKDIQPPTTQSPTNACSEHTCNTVALSPKCQNCAHVVLHESQIMGQITANRWVNGVYDTVLVAITSSMTRITIGCTYGLSTFFADNVHLALFPHVIDGCGRTIYM